MKLSRHSGEMLNDVTYWKSPGPCPSEANKNTAAANVKTDAASAVFRAGAPTMINTAATIGQKITNSTISGREGRQRFLCPRNTRKDAKILKVKIGRLMDSGQEALVFYSRIVAKVHEETQFAAGGGEIIQDLRPVLVD